MRKRSLWLRVATVGLVVAGLLAVAVPAQALQAFVCTGTGQTIVLPGTGDGVQTWIVEVNGLCAGDTRGSYRWIGAAFGTSTGAGLCTPGLPLTNDFSLGAVQTLLSQVKPQFSRVFLELWSMPGNLPTTYPVATPFTVAGAAFNLGGVDKGTVLGAGAIASRIFLNCAPAGSNSSIQVQVRLVN